MAFIKTAKQIEACDVINNHVHGLVYGGSRSGKTTIITRNIILRALKKKSRHLMVRFRFNHAKTSLWYDTIPKVMDMCFPGLEWQQNKSDWFISFEPANSFGGESQIWLGGIDDKDRVEKILGNEYSTIYSNESSQVSYDAINTLRTRLAESSGLPLRFYYDLNPSGKKHWTYQEFVEKRVPGTQEGSKLDTGVCVINPLDNIQNLPKEYIGILEGLPKRQRERFLEGKYLSDIEGALWSESDLDIARSIDPGEVIKTVIAVDPATTSNKDSDETGIVVCSLCDSGKAVVEADLTGKYKPKVWATRVKNAYEAYQANAVVVETNQGGDMVEEVLRSVAPNIPIIKIHAKKGKFVRAEPVQALYEQGMIAHEREAGLDDLETQMTEWVPMSSSGSPDRIDALVYGLSHLMLPETKESKVRGSLA